MKKFFLHPLALAAASLSIASLAQAQQAASNDAAASTTTPAATNTAPASNGGTLGGLFNAPGTTGSSSQLSATPSYELAGIGRRDATQERILTSATNGLPIRFDNGIYVYTSATGGLGHNSNVSGVNTGAISSNFYSVQPEVVGELKKAGDRYTLRYAGNYTKYTGSSADNFNHHFFDLAGDNYFDSRTRLGWDLGYVDQTDARGSTSVTVNTPNRWTAPTARALLAYGAPQAQGRVELEGNYVQKRYQNNRDVTASFDTDLTTVSGRFFYRVMPRTSMIFELRQTNADYKTATISTNTDRRYYVGATWEATAKTSGTFKIGYAEKKFSNAPIKATGVSWEGGLRWSPLTYSTFDLITSKAPADSTGVGNYLMNTATSLQWNHRWASNLSSRASVGTVKTDFSGAGRTDTTNNVGIGAFYELGRNWRAGAEYTYTDRSSNQNTFNFNRNVTYVSIQGTL
ncbi:outer membrane beta-barrel protein [Curvibacter sp. HBC28]|uniref:Outer membrane beta-barrel protein n=1 Tax=Curvibacter microcysteis TaxID=3026419 RepID=A0ABT5MDB0_9BURK|nr:outer membrane beta-barrel protein [Curvibacter sp. HBC28]MDD0814580.1 outer membrane beta-barrel protein [Curvibacter sp. HBC28]